MSEAVNVGGDLLSRFRSAKAKDSSFSKSFAANDEHSVSGGFFDAVADGSNLGLAYSATKRRDQNASSMISASGLFMSTPAERDPNKSYAQDSEAIDLIRTTLARVAFLQQSDKENISKDISDIITMLQGVEEHLEALPAPTHANASHPQKDAFASLSPGMSPRTKTPLADRNRGSEGGDGRDPRSLLKVYMDNQLDLNESEMQQYEDMMNDLADKLEAITGERDEQVAANSALGERLRHLSAEKDNDLQKWIAEKTALQQSLQEVEQLSEDTKKAWGDDVEKMQAALNSSLQSEELLRCEVRESKGESETLALRLSSLQADLDSLAREAAIAADKEAALQLELKAAAEQIARLESTYASIIPEHEALRAELDEQRRDAMTSLEAHRSIVHSMQTEIDKLQQESQISDAQSKQESASREAALESRVEELASQADSWRQAADAQSERAGDLANKMAAVQSESDQLKLELESAKQQQVETMQTLAEMRASTTVAPALKTPNQSVIDSTHDVTSEARVDTRAPRSLLKVYMDNQLDLNESEMQHYEDMMNDLADKLEAMTGERDEAQNAQSKQEGMINDLEAQLEEVEQERDVAQNTLLELEDARADAANQLECMRQELQSKDNAIGDLHRQLEDNAALLSQLYMEKDHLMSRLVNGEDTIAEGRQGAELVAGPVDAVAAPPTPAPAKTPNQSVLSSGGSSARVDTRAPRSLLKVYMDNQLDLNESEMQHYEDMMNDLADKLEAMTGERDEAQSAYANSAEELNALKLAQTVQHIAAAEAMQQELQSAFAQVKQLQEEREVLLSKLIDAEMAAEFKNGEFANMMSDKAAELERTEQSLIEIRIQLDQTRQQSFMPMHPPLPATSAAGSGDASFSAISESVSNIHRNDSALDVEALLQQKEVQIRMQTSQLENYQDMLSEQQRANNLLKEQRNKLREMVDAYKKSETELLENAAALRGRDEWMSQRVAQLEAVLRKEAEVRIENAVNLDEMHAALQASQQGLSLSLSAGAASPPMASPNKSALGSATPGRITRLESMVQQLTADLAATEYSKNALQLEHDRLTVRLQSRSQHMEDLVRETEGLKADIDVRLTCIDDMKAKGQMSDAATHTALLERDATIAHLGQKIAALESTQADTNILLANNAADLENAKQALSEAQEMIESQKETDAVLEELAAEREDLNLQIESLLAELQEQCDANEQLKEKIVGIERETRDRETLGSSELENYQYKCATLEEELGMVRLQLRSMHGDLTSNASILSERLEALHQEKLHADALIRQQKQILLQKENELYTKTNSVDTLTRAAQSTSQTMNYYHSQLSSQTELFERHVAERLMRFESRVAGLSSKVAMAAQATLVHKSDHDAPPLWTHMHETMAGVGNGGADSRIDGHASHQQVQALQIQLQNESQSNAQVFERLSERLEDAERRAVEASTANARSQAQAMRTQAYLDGECTRLRSLVDHLRLVNAKLMDDMKIVRTDGAQLKTLEHRLHTVQAEASRLQEALQLADHAHAASVAQVQEQAITMREETDREMAKLQQALQFAQAQVQRLQQEQESSNEAMAQLTSASTQEQAELMQKLAWFEDQMKQYAAAAQSHEAAAHSSAVSAAAAIERATQLEQSLQEIRAEQQNMLQDWQRKAAEFSEDGEEASRRVTELTQALATARANLQSAEEQIFSKEASQAAQAAKVAEYADEARRLRAQCDLLQEQQAGSAAHQDDREALLRDARREAETALAQLEDFKSKTYRQALAHTTELESSLSLVQGELQNVQNSLRTAERECQFFKESVTHAESRVAASQGELVSQRAKEAAMQERLSSLTQESDYYRSQWEEALAAQQLQSREVASMRTTVQDKNSHIETYEARIHQLERDITVGRGKLQSLQTLDTELSSVAREIGDLVPRTIHGADAHDLFASPVATSSSMQSPPLPADKSGLLPRSSHALSSLRVRVDGFLAQHELLVAQLDNLKADKSDAHDARVRQEAQLRVAEAGREELEHQTQALQIQLSGAHEKCAVVAAERDRLLSTTADQTNKTRAVLHDLTSALSDVVDRAAAASAACQSSSSLAPTYSLSETIPESSWQLVLPTQALTNDYSTSALLTTVVHETERVLGVLCSSLEAAVTDSVAKSFAAQKAEALLAEKERSMDASFDASFYGSAQQQGVASLQGGNALQRAEKEVYQLRITLSELNRHKIELENEVRQSGDINSDLRLALSEAESLCGDLRSHVRSLQNDRDRLEDDTAAVEAALDQQRRRCLDAELALERQTADLNRLRGENESLSTLRRTLETELDRRAAQSASAPAALNSAAAGQGHSAGESPDRLLYALSSTFDALMTLPNPPPLARDSAVPLRQESAVKMLSGLASWMREESRTRRALADKAAWLEGEIKNAKAETEERTSALKKLSSANAELAAELKEKKRDLIAQGSDFGKANLECDKAKREAAAALSQLDEERHSKQRLQGELSGLTQESTKLKMETESQRSIIAKLQSAHQSHKEKIAELEVDVEHKAEQLRASKAATVKLTLALEQLERSEAKERRERDAMESKKGEADIARVALSRLQARYSELESTCKQARETVASLRESNSALDKQLSDSTKECDAVKRRLQVAENRAEYSSNECRTLESGLAAMRSELLSARDKFAEEHAAKLRAESALETSRASMLREDAARSAGAPDSRVGNTKTTAMLTKQLQAAEERQRVAEEERNGLNAKLQATRTALESKDTALMAEQLARQANEEQVARNASKMEHLQREVSTLRESASSLRQEGRRARTQVLEAVSQMREVVNIIRADASAAGTLLATPEKVRPSLDEGGSGQEGGVSKGSQQSLLEALSIAELSSALSALRDSIIYLRQSQKQTATLQSTVRTLEREKAAVREEADVLSKKRDALGDEVLGLQKRVAELTSAGTAASSSSRSGEQSLAVSDAALKRERSDKEKVLRELEAARDQLAAVNAELNAARRVGDAFVEAAPAETLASLQADKALLESQRAQLQAELKATAHHKKVLGDTIERLERQAQKASEQAADSAQQLRSREERDRRSSPSSGLSSGDSKDDLEALKRSVARYRARASALEEMAMHYRQGLMAMYPSGDVYGAAQFALLNQAEGQGEWFEREIALVQRTFESVVRGLENESADLWGRLRQSSSFTAELSRRFEETLQQQFRSMKGSTADSLAKQLEFLAVSQKKADLIHGETLAALQQERESNRSRFSQLIDQLKGAMRLRGESVWESGWGGRSDALASPVVDRHAALADYSATPDASGGGGGGRGVGNTSSVSFQVLPINPVTTFSAQATAGGGARASAGSFRVRRAGAPSAAVGAPSAGVSTSTSSAFNGAPPSPASYRGASAHLSDLANRIKSPR